MKKIDNEFNNPIKELENEWIQTKHGVFTPNETLGLNAYEVYEKYVYDLENPPIPKPALEEIVEEQANKISILEGENESLKNGLKAVLSGDMQTLAYILYPQDFINEEIMILPELSE